MPRARSIILGDAAATPPVAPVAFPRTKKPNRPKSGGIKIDKKA